MEHVRFQGIFSEDHKFYFRLEIMESMALYQETAYEKLYRWAQGTLIKFLLLSQFLLNKLNQFLVSAVGDDL